MSRLKTVEDAVYTYLKTLVPDATTYQDEFPRAAVAFNSRMLMFAMEGGGDVMDVQSTDQLYAWVITGYVRGIYADRDNALTDLWAIMEAMPIDPGTVSEIQRVDVTKPYSISRTVIELENDLSAGGETRFWAWELPLEITFERT